MEYSGDPRAWCRQLEAAQGAGIRVIAQAPADVGHEAIQVFANAARPSGYIVLDAHRDMPGDQRRRLWHRHVALVHRAPASAVSTRWVRELAHASPRGHAVVIIAAQPDCVQEAALALTQELDLLAPPGTESDTRTGRLWRRGRWAAARRWTGSAIESARRTADDMGAARGFCQLVSRSDVRAEARASALMSRGRRLLQEIQQLAARSHVVAALADIWITQGAFEMATAALSSIEVECVLTGVAVPPWIRAPQSEVACWEGEWDRADHLAGDAAHAGWRALAAFGRRDWAAVRLAASAGAHDDAGKEGWPALLNALGCGVSEDKARVVDARQHVHACEGPPRWRDAVMLECLRMAGAEDDANEWVRTVDMRPRGAAEQLLWRWATSSGRRESTAPLDAAVRRAGAAGIRRFGVRRQHMQMWAGVSSLLQQVHEADDAGAAMQRGCRWARDYTGVDRVAIVAHDGTVVACDPEKRHQGTGAEAPAEPVRYGGVCIGAVVVRGPARDEAEARVVAQALATACAPALRARLDELMLSRAGDTLAGELLGVSPGMRALRESVARAAASTFPVLIEGESGTGKELVARAVHRLSARRDRRWAAVNCAALTDELVEAELFGHARGAFTGAVGQRVGLLESAHEGTLFLDEVAELSSRAQAKLLRVLQEGEIRRVGENGSRRVDVRIVAATNRPLTEAAKQGQYREDLVFRLAVIRLQVPPLRDRIEDVPMLALAFWRATASRVSTRAILSPDAVGALCRFTWPGNVRELQNVIATLAVSGPTRGRISARHVAGVLSDRSGWEPLSPPLSLAAARELSDRRVVAASLARHANQRTAAARELGVSRQGLAKLIARLNLTDSASVVASQGPFL